VRGIRPVVLALLAFAPALQGQSHVRPRPAYFGNDRLEILIFGDSVTGVEIWTTFDTTAVGFHRTARFLPGDVLTWVAAAESLLVPKPLGDPARWTHPSMLPATNGDALVLGRMPEGNHWERRADLLYLRHTPAGDSVLVDARFELWDAKDFLDSLQAKAIAARAYVPHRDSASDDLVESRPELLQFGPLVYPELERSEGLEGRVLISAMVDTSGRVIPQSMEVMMAVDSAFARAARSSLAHSRFKPARKHGGIPVQISILIPFRFTLHRR